MRKDCSLYIHIPFCLQKCDYCDFFSRCSNSVEEKYVKALANEISIKKEFYGIDSFYTVYVGGGTPSLLSADQISRLFGALNKMRALDSCREITFEVNPETLTAEKILALKDSGVTRLSMGVQSVNDEVLKAVRRHCSSEKIYNALELLHLWNGDLNLDLIAGLPNDTEKSFNKSLKEITDFGPSHISLYALTVEEETPIYSRIENRELNYDADYADFLWLSGRDYLEQKGYFQYEVSNFCKPGKESLHNMNYWEQGQYIGCGSGATGTVYDFLPEGKINGGMRFTNTDDINFYADFWTDSISKDFFCKDSKFLNYEKIPGEKEILLPETLEFEFLMMGLRTLKGISSDKYFLRYGKPLGKRLLKSKLWEEYLKNGYAVKIDSGGNEKYALTKDGILYLNSFLCNL